MNEAPRSPTAISWSVWPAHFRYRLMSLPSVDLFVGLAVRTQATLNGLHKPEQQPMLSRTGRGTHWTLQALFRHGAVLVGNRLLRHHVTLLCMVVADHRSKKDSLASNPSRTAQGSLDRRGRRGLRQRRPGDSLPADMRPRRSRLRVARGPDRYVLLSGTPTLPRTP